jgi:hypothetical protein
MAYILHDRVLESTTTTGLGALTLAAAVTGFRRFNAVCSVGDTFMYYVEAVDSTGVPSGDYEYGIGTYSAANTLTRTTVLGSSNAGAAVNFAAGSKNVGMGLLVYGFQRGTAASGEWERHPNGNIEQWGTAVTGGGGTVAVTFPIPFPSTCDQVLVTTNDSAASIGNYVSATTTGVTLQAWTVAGAAGPGKSVSWRAKGR